MKQGKKTKSALGRPSGGDGDRVRSELLQAARNLFLANDFKAVSIRQIANAAGVNGAMVSYYFGGKQGLYLAMVEALLQSLQENLEALEPGTEISIAEFSASYCRLLADNPWWPNFMVREVLFSDGEIRGAIIAKISSTFAPRLLQGIEREISNGHYRANLNPGLTLVSLMAMTVFPFVAKPLLEQVLNIRIDKNFADLLASHNTQLFLHGVHASAQDQVAGDN